MESHCENDERDRKKRNTKQLNVKKTIWDLRKKGKLEIAKEKKIKFNLNVRQKKKIEKERMKDTHTDTNSLQTKICS